MTYVDKSLIILISKFIRKHLWCFIVATAVKHLNQKICQLLAALEENLFLCETKAEKFISVAFSSIFLIRLVVNGPVMKKGKCEV